MAETGIDAGETNKPVTDPLVAEIHKRIREAFSPFDDDNNGTVDVRQGILASVAISGRYSKL